MPLTNPSPESPSESSVTSPKMRQDTGSGPRQTLAGLRRKPLSSPTIQAPDLTTAGVISRIDGPHGLRNRPPENDQLVDPEATTNEVLPIIKQRTGPDRLESRWRATDSAQSEDSAQSDLDDDAQLDYETQTSQQMLRLHAAALIQRLQAWANDLDAREANLNARAAIQEHGERSFRLKRQSFEIDMAEQERRIQRLKERIEQHARRLAFATR